MFAQHRNRNVILAAGRTLSLIYHQTVYNLRTEHRNAIIGLLLTIAQSTIFILAFLSIYVVIGVRSSPIRADFALFVMSGILMFMVHTQAAVAVSGSHSVSGGLARHQPLNAAVLIAASALAVLYRQTAAVVVILWGYHMLFSPVHLVSIPGCLAMFLLAWFSGACIGLIFLGIRPWWPKGSKLITTIFQRINMFASGKMFVANLIPGFMFPWFAWNPLFHVIDQTRGQAFINYTPMRTDPLYAIWFSLGCMMVGLLINFSTRKYESLSWSATT